MCFICDRIKMIQEGKNPYFVKELETGYVVIGDNQHLLECVLNGIFVSWFGCRGHYNVGSSVLVT